MRDGERFGSRRVDRVRIAALLAAASLLLGLWLPTLRFTDGASDARSLATGDGDFVVYVLIAVGLMLAGAFAVESRRPEGCLLAAGAAVTIAAFLAFITSFDIDRLDPSAGVRVGPGLVCAYVSLPLCALVFGFGLGARDGRATRCGGPHAVLGVLAAAGMIVGAMLPTTAAISFSRLNFRWHPWYVELGRILSICSFGVTALIGFSARRAWGWWLTVGGLAPTTWLVLAGVIGRNSGGGLTLSFLAIHQVVVISLVGAIVAAVWFRVALSTRRVAEGLVATPPQS